MAQNKIYRKKKKTKVDPEGIGFVGMILNLVIALIVSSLTEPPPKEIGEMVERIRQP